MRGPLAVDELNFKWGPGFLIPTNDDTKYCTDCTAKYKASVVEGRGTCMVCHSTASAAGQPTQSHDDILPFPQGGDHDEPYTFDRRPTVAWPFPFTGPQFARLLVLRGRVRAEKEAASL